jgi:hypothetical protein
VASSALAASSAGINRVAFVVTTSTPDAASVSVATKVATATTASRVMTAFSVARQVGAYPPAALSRASAIAASATLLAKVFAVVLESTDEQASDAEIYSLAIVPIVSALEEASSAELS